MYKVRDYSNKKEFICTLKILEAAYHDEDQTLFNYYCLQKANDACICYNHAGSAILLINNNYIEQFIQDDLNSKLNLHLVRADTWYDKFYNFKEFIAEPDYLDVETGEYYEVKTKVDNWNSYRYIILDELEDKVDHKSGIYNSHQNCRFMIYAHYDSVRNKLHYTVIDKNNNTICYESTEQDYIYNYYPVKNITKFMK